jgi:predicted ABC-type ATPase
MSNRIRRMRVFAGPNGSGKSTIIKEIQQKVFTGIYINADDIEKACKDKGFINLGDFGLESTQKVFLEFFEQSTLVAKALKEGYKIDLAFSDNIIKVPKETNNSYAAALIADYLRNLLIDKGETFSFETVMSHESKLSMLQRAQNSGFKIYLYFICTESPEINVGRVAARVAKGGHNVEEQKIRERYDRSLALLSALIPFCHRSYLFDNSEESYRWILEIQNGKLEIKDPNIPDWIYTHVFVPLDVKQ